MDKKILELNEEAKNHIKNKRSHEDFFNLGVKLGRLLKQLDIESCRLPAFEEQEKIRSEKEEKRKIIEKIETLLFGIAMNSFRAEIKDSGSISIDVSRYGGHKSCFSEKTTSRFSIRHCKSDQDGDGGDFHLEFQLEGMLKEIFHRHGIEESFSMSMSNHNGENSEEIYREDELKDYFYSLYLSSRYQIDHYSIIQLENLFADLEKNTLFAYIKGS